LTIAEINTEAGQVVGPGSSIVSMADLNAWEIDTDDLSEVDVINVQPDQAVTITFDALPGVKLNGKVLAVTPKAQTKRGDVTHTVKIAIESPDPRLKWGMTGQVEIAVRGRLTPPRSSLLFHNLNLVVGADLTGFGNL